MQLRIEIKKYEGLQTIETIFCSDSPIEFNFKNKHHDIWPREWMAVARRWGGGAQWPIKQGQFFVVKIYQIAWAAKIKRGQFFVVKIYQIAWAAKIWYEQPKLASYVGLGPKYYRRPRPTRVGPIGLHRPTDFLRISWPLRLFGWKSHVAYKSNKLLYHYVGPVGLMSTHYCRSSTVKTMFYRFINMNYLCTRFYRLIDVLAQAWRRNMIM